MARENPRGGPRRGPFCHLGTVLIGHVPRASDRAPLGKNLSILFQGIVLASNPDQVGKSVRFLFIQPKGLKAIGEAQTAPRSTAGS